ncbi:MAG: hypothetical protein M0R20_07655 [Candidatus Omnitrophica bacterium]|jgi:hypothetical protein|nr:hypothetical protein [Candidatus Omnitrophota bacterium]
MKIPKEKIKVLILCTDGAWIKGLIHISEGLRVSDFLNDQKNSFIAVTNAEVQNLREVHSFKLASGISKARNTLLLNIQAIKWVEEL